jgi:hypothetical protein
LHRPIDYAIINSSATPNKGNKVIFPKIGQTIKVNFDVEIEEDDGYILRLEAGEEMTVVSYDDLAGRDMTPEQYFEEFEAIELIVECGDITVQNQFDRSGCSDYEVSGKIAAISVGEDSGLQIVE